MMNIYIYECCPIPYIYLYIDIYYIYRYIIFLSLSTVFQSLLNPLKVPKDWTKNSQHPSGPSAWVVRSLDSMRVFVTQNSHPQFFRQRGTEPPRLFVQFSRLNQQIGIFWVTSKHFILNVILAKSSWNHPPVTSQKKNRNRTNSLRTFSAFHHTPNTATKNRVEQR